MKVIALDIGDSSIGIAISDELNVIASPFGTYKRKSKMEDVSFFKSLIEQNNSNVVVVGLPLDLYGQIGDQAKKVIKYINFLKKYLDVNFIYIDERYTTSLANRTLIQTNTKKGKQKGIEDSLAACFILETYFSKNKKGDLCQKQDL